MTVLEATVDVIFPISSRWYPGFATGVYRAQTAVTPGSTGFYRGHAGVYRAWCDYGISELIVS